MFFLLYRKVDIPNIIELPVDAQHPHDVHKGTVRFLLTGFGRERPNHQLGLFKTLANI